MKKVSINYQGRDFVIPYSKVSERKYEVNFQDDFFRNFNLPEIFKYGINHEGLPQYTFETNLETGKLLYLTLNKIMEQEAKINPI